MAALRHPNIVLFLGLTYSPPSIITGGSRPQCLNPKTAGTVMHRRFQLSRAMHPCCITSTLTSNLLARPDVWLPLLTSPTLPHNTPPCRVLLAGLPV